MAYAPILDASAYTSAMEPDRQMSLAAAAELQRMAQGEATLLRDALQVLEAHAGDCGQGGPQPSSALLAAVEQLPGVQESVKHSGLAEQKEVLLRRLVEQLSQVKAFGELDGGTVADYIGPVGRLIRSGRVELFAGTPGRTR